MIRVDHLPVGDQARWDAYVRKTESATFFHLSGWRQVIEQAFGHRSHYLYAERDGQVVGILPLMHIDSRLFGNALISNAFCVYGGIVADDELAFAALCQQARQLAGELGVDYLEMRNRQRNHPDWPSKPLYATFIKTLEATPEAAFAAIPGKRRNHIRHAIKAGLSCEVSDDVEAFYRCYAESVRNLGTPVFGKRYFQLLKQVFGDDCEIILVKQGQLSVAGVMSFYFRDQVLPYYAGGGKLARQLSAHDLMYWRVMCRGLERGCRVFDFGRSKQGTGAFRYKQFWGFQPQALYYEVDLIHAEHLPEVNPLNPKYRYFIAAWKRLPLAVSQWLGPWLAKDLG